VPQRLDDLRRSFWFRPAVGIGVGFVPGFPLRDALAAARLA
jgi:hypothetical protein